MPAWKATDDVSRVTAAIERVTTGGIPPLRRSDRALSQRGFFGSMQNERLFTIVMEPACPHVTAAHVSGPSAMAADAQREEEFMVQQERQQQQVARKS